ncbi:hypothetical protein HOI83_04380, partial [Candidatus Uhrbacteria bacterium]|nr:hypothetical protein [Candidatus Uhrbacteria bacterium]
SITDNQAPTFVEARYQDTDNDGQVETLWFQFSEDITTVTPSIDEFSYTVNDLTGSALDVSDPTVSGGGGNLLTFEFGTYGDAGVTSTTTVPTISYAPGTGSAGPFTDLAGNNIAAFTNQPMWDNAAPVITSFTYQDSDNDGKIDQVLATFSEAVDQTSVLAPADLTFSSAGADVGDFTGAAFGASNTNVIVSDSVTTATIPLGTEATVVDTSEDSASISIDSQAAFSLIDEVDPTTNAVLGTQSQAAYVDGAGPVLISSSPEDAETGVVSSSTVDLTFSETMDTGTFAYSCCGAGTDPGRTGAWTVSDTVYTITPTANWSNGEDITINITTADDVVSSPNAFAGAVTGMNDPFTFTISSPSGGTPTPGTGPAAVVTTAMLLTPNGAEILQGNSAYSITWLASGDNLDTISLYYSSDNGQNYSIIASGESNDGSYSWTVPNETVATGKIRVDAVTSSGGVLIDDESNASFSISTIVSPPEPETAEPELTGPVLAEMTAPDGEILEIREGSLFRGVELSGVYLVKDGTRYVFPSEAVFLSRYTDFSGVVQVDDDQLRELPFGGRMTMAEGSLIKIQSDNRVYVVLDDIGTITHIPDETTAISTYGADWAQLVHDISVVFWFDYTVE